jgi:hypothetical protein
LLLLVFGSGRCWESTSKMYKKSLQASHEAPSIRLFMDNCCFVMQLHLHHPESPRSAWSNKPSIFYKDVVLNHTAFQDFCNVWATCACFEIAWNA